MDFFLSSFLEIAEVLAFYLCSYFLQRNKIPHVGPITVVMMTMVIIIIVVDIIVVVTVMVTRIYDALMLC